MRYLSNLLILLAFIGCAETKTDLSGNTPLKINDFISQNSGFESSYSPSNERIKQKIETSKYIVLLDYLNVNGPIKNNKRIPQNYQIKIMVGIKK